MKILIFLLVMSLFSFQSACTGASIGFSVSCTIPAIPGVNAPAAEEAPPAEQQESEPEETETSRGSYEQTMLVAVETQRLVTFYSR